MDNKINKKQVFKIVSKINKKITFSKFIKEYDIRALTITDFIHDDIFIDKFTEFLEKKDFHSSKIFDLFYDLFVTLGYEDSFDILESTYKFAVNLSFPGTIEINFSSSELSYINLLLKILKSFSELEKIYGEENWSTKFSIKFLSIEEEEQLESSLEYVRFKKYYCSDYVNEMMKLSQDLHGRTTLDHVSGVHYLSMKVARQLKTLKFPIDLGKVSGAAAGHDIGKYGCKKDELSRVAYYHYYYTGEWFKRHNITYIRNIAINHSTWDLELDNLQIEALLLIYADFRVKADSDRKMKFYTLDEAFDVILTKLDNVDEAKELRYRKVYNRLKDFEEFLLFFDVNIDVFNDNDVKEDTKKRRKYYSLIESEDIPIQTKFASIEHNIKVMFRLRDEESLNKLLEKARDVKNLIAQRGYIKILREYSTYLTHKQKLIAINYLYDIIVTVEEDIRESASNLIGKLIANFDEELRKEVPKGAIPELLEMTSLGLFEIYISKFLFPDHKIVDKHRVRIMSSAKRMLKSYFVELTDESKINTSLELLSNIYDVEMDNKKLGRHLLNSVSYFPIKNLDKDQRKIILDFIVQKVIGGNYEIRLLALEKLYIYANTFGKDIFDYVYLDIVFDKNRLKKKSSVELYSIFKSYRCLYDDYKDFENEIYSNIKSFSELYLSNLKTVTLEIVKKIQVEILLKTTIKYKTRDAFYTALHFCNLLKVSSKESVRNLAGRGLIELLPILSVEQKNDIVVELLRAIEMESYQVSRYIPDYLGKLMLFTKPKELNEIIDDFSIKIKKSNAQTGMLVLKTIGVAVQNYNGYSAEFNESNEKNELRLKKMLGILLNGFVSFLPSVTQTAFDVIGSDIFANANIDIEFKRKIFDLIEKKLLSLIITTNEKIDLVFFNNSAGLKHIYSFISEYNIKSGKLKLTKHDKIAFFPGAFDPFSLSHKQIATEIRDLGYVVYLAVDEFSWSKRTHPNLRRRDIIKMSVADELNIYTYPRDLIVNISNKTDLDNLRNTFKNDEVYIVVGSDVIVNASAYKNDEEKAIKSFAHIVFDRNNFEKSKEEIENYQSIFSKLPKNSIKLKLSSKYENISSTQIRNYIDENRDISELVDPLAQRYIYERGLYQREPLFKQVMTIKSVTIEIVKRPSLSLLEELATLLGNDFSKDFSKLKELTEFSDYRMIVIRSILNNRKVIGFSGFHWLRSSEIYSEFEDEYIENYIRDNSVGRILVIDGIYSSESSDDYSSEQIVLTETLAYALAKDYTYAVFKNKFSYKTKRSLINIMKNQGFIEKKGVKTKEDIFVVDMSAPCTLNLDLKSAIKEPYRNSSRMLKVVTKTRNRLQEALTNLYAGNLVISFERTMLYENLIKKICDENKMPTTPLKPKIVGEAMCVPFGAIFKRWILPNTATKAFHAEKYFKPDLTKYKIDSYPYYLDIENQVKTLKSFNKPIMLVDDILNKGYRIKALNPLFKKYDVDFKKFFVGIMSGRGKALMEKENIEVDSAYYIPRLKVWFNEAKVYPFIGGDGVMKKVLPNRNIIPSINLLLPYSFPAYIKGASKESIFKLSEVALENAIDILNALEEEYQDINNKMLTLGQLGEVVITPRFPDKGENISLDFDVKASEYLKTDLEHLRRLKSMFLMGEYK
ncbi:nicotinate-nicotinamide nucleotide adenylyltransferase [Helicovermis profundi]|uniref:nicotinate-nucleotide adenylyltransferase n=1 Tax=Helicovermis profundi TaxID=3065157 RepID=A0AAU9E506_9FIRM|nr:hypothetical protein HLPR_20920 [Clostridia bacterium S502]